MNTSPFSTTRQQAAAGALALALTFGMLLGVNGLAEQGGAAAQLASAAALMVAAPKAASGV